MEYFLRKYPAWRSTQPRKNSGIFLVWGTGGIQYYQYFTYSPQMNLGVNVNHIGWQELKKDLTRLGGPGFEDSFGFIQAGAASYEGNNDLYPKAFQLPGLELWR